MGACAVMHSGTQEQRNCGSGLFHCFISYFFVCIYVCIYIVCVSSFSRDES